ncbi:O-antigen ligase family protein [Lysobacter arvi]|nr:O-antigen ligase family protein [Lysobacter arvi]
MLDRPRRESHSPRALPHTALRIAQWCGVGAFAAVPINKPATNILLALCTVFSLLGAGAGPRWQASWNNPIAKGFLLWAAVLVASALRVPGTPSWPGSFVLACAYPLILASVFVDERWGKRALAAFAIAVSLTMLASYAMQVGLLPQRAVVSAAPNMRNTVFKEYTQQGLSTLILGCMCMAIALAETSKRRRFYLVVLAGIAAANVLFLLGSRTADLVLMPLVAYFAWRLAARRPAWVRVLLTVTALVALGAIAYLSPVMRTRVVASLPAETTRYVEEASPTATGIRMQLWRRSLEIVSDAPLFGHGLDQWRPAYRAAMQAHGDKDAFLAGHPHQELLLIVAEQGIVGLAIYLALLIALVLHVRKLAPPWRDTYTCLIVIYVFAGLANCLWGDFTHRHTFVLLIACVPALMKSARSAGGRA